MLAPVELLLYRFECEKNCFGVGDVEDVEDDIEEAGNQFAPGHGER